MALFDWLVVDYPLPDGFDASGHAWQTQDTPDQSLEVYTLRADGCLVTETGEVVSFDGPLTFYATNLAGAGPSGYMTRDDAPLWWAEYTAQYDQGILRSLTGARRLDTDRRGPHLTQAEWHAHAREYRQ